MKTQPFSLEELVDDIRRGYITMSNDKLYWIGSGDIESAVHLVRLVGDQCVMAEIVEPALTFAEQRAAGFDIPEEYQDESRQT